MFKVWAFAKVLIISVKADISNTKMGFIDFIFQKLQSGDNIVFLVIFAQIKLFNNTIIIN